MAEEPKTIMLDGGRDARVTLIAGADAFLSQLLAGAPSKAGAATLRVVKNAAGVPFVAVLIAGKHVGFLSHADADGLLPVLARCEQDRAAAATRATLASPSGTSAPILTLSLALPDQLMRATTTAASLPPVTPPDTKRIIGRHCRDCGQLLPGAATFCLACGTPVAEIASTAQGAVVPTPPPRPAPPVAEPARAPISPLAAASKAPRPTEFAKALPKKQGWWARQDSRRKLVLIAGTVAVLLIVIVASVISGGGGDGARDLAGITRGDDSTASANRGLVGPASSSTTVSETSVASMGGVTESTATERSSSTGAKASVTTAEAASATTAGPATTATTVKATTTTIMATTNTVAPAVEGEDIIVYRTDTGKKYHRAGCQHLADSQIPITLAEAEALGLGPCKTCDPPM